MTYPCIVNLIILDELRRQLLTRTPFDHLPEGVWKRTSALNTWGTNAIEGNTLTWVDVEKLLLRDLSVGNRPRRDIMETIQHETTFRILLRRRTQPIALSTVLELHEEVFRGILDDAGQWRHVNVRIAGAKHAPPRMEKVVPAMEEWEADYNRRDMLGEEVFALAAWMHFQFESIHPFSDGNGRVGRLLLNLHFLRHSWPPVHVQPYDRSEYLSSLEAAHAGDLEVLIGFLRTAMAHSLVDLLDQLGTEEDELQDLKHIARNAPYSARYLSLRAGQGELPAVMVKGDWRTSARALRLYMDNVGWKSKRQAVRGKGARRKR